MVIYANFYDIILLSTAAAAAGSGSGAGISNQPAEQWETESRWTD